MAAAVVAERRPGRDREKEVGVGLEKRRSERERVEKGNLSLVAEIANFGGWSRMYLYCMRVIIGGEGEIKVGWEKSIV